MPAHQNESCLPAVLKTYNPSYEPNRKVQNKEVTKPREDVISPAKQQEPAKKRPQSSAPFTQTFVREKTIDIKAQEREKRLKSFRYWELVKQEIKDEDTEKLKQKINLQLQLIRAQELLYQQKVQQEEEEKNKKREEDRAFKRAQAEALLAICRKSLAKDRRKLRDAQHRSKSTTTAAGDTVSKETGGNSPSKRSPTKTPQPVQSIPTKVLLDDSEDERDDMPPLPKGFVTGSKKEAVELSSGMSSLASTPQPPSGSSTPLLREISTNITREATRASTLPEEEEEEEVEEEEDEFVDFPFYQQQLYRLYGREAADYFLYPKVEAEAKKKSKPLDPKFKNPDGRTGANELWTNLRHESRSKLLKVDRTIKDELKDAFGAFARESLSLKRPNVKRNFCNKEDVPEIDQLMDQSVVHGAQDYRHRMELMYRSSHINEDRCKVLLYNNPIPNLNNMQGADSVSRYMPSWVDDGQEDLESEKSYRKWLLTNGEVKDTGSVSEVTEGLRQQPSLVESKPGVEKSAQERQEPEQTGAVEKSDPRKDTAKTSQLYPEEALLSLPEEWDFTMARKPAADDRPKLQRYHFLTEREARTPGQFRKRQEEARKARALPKSYQMQEGTQATGPLVNRSMDRTLGSTGRSAFAMSTDFTLSSGRPHTLSTQQDIPSWEPLSMDALMEYRDKKQTLGNGEFRRGKAATWHIQHAAIVEG